MTSSSNQPTRVIKKSLHDTIKNIVVAFDEDDVEYTLEDNGVIDDVECAIVKFISQFRKPMPDKLKFGDVSVIANAACNNLIDEMLELL